MSSQVSEQLNNIFEEAKGEFFATVNKILEKHFRKSELSQGDLNRLEDGQNQIPYLFERIMIIAYQKDEPLFSKWIQLGDKDSMDKFRKKFIALARDYAARFGGSLFRKSAFAEFSMMLPHNKGKSTLDLVLQTLGYRVNNNLPDIPHEERFKNKIEPDFYSQWGIDAINARKCWPLTKGSSVVVAIIDSGIDPYNSLFKDKIVPGFNFLERTTPPWSDERPSMIDYGLHGTGVSSVLLAIAPDCRIMPVRIADADTMNDPPYDYWLIEWAAAGIYYAVNRGAHIISKSARLLPAEPVTAEAVRYAYEHNVVICSSAGNMPRVHLGLRPEEMLYRAFDKEVLLIGGVEKREEQIRPWPYSVPGPFVDITAPSKDVFVLVPVYMKDQKNSYVAGTSLSAPIAAGVAALMRSVAPPSDEILKNPGAYVRLVSRSLKETGRLEILGMAEPNEAVGYGLIDAYAAIKKIQDLIKQKRII
ncbi:MAG: S8 family serine peptidase, partial [Candidatus Omnitrophota bacterium]